MSDSCDILIVGAGPAGSVAARQAARRGYDVVLVEKTAFPRHKVCGGCLSPNGVDALAQLGLAHLLQAPRATPIERLELRCLTATATVPLNGGCAVPRDQFDQDLLTAATECGVRLRMPARAAWRDASADHIVIELHSSAGCETITCKAVVAADGLAGSFTRSIPGVRLVKSPYARVGAGTLVDASLFSDTQLAPSHTIQMIVGARGYVGLVRLPDGRADLAAAVDVRVVKQRGLAATIEHLLETGGFDQARAQASLRLPTSWRGTPQLTQHTHQPHHPRVLLLGDAAGYVEPFTGEGMTWAIKSGAAAQPTLELLVEGRGVEAKRAWRRIHRQLIGGSQQRCWWTTLAVRSPAVTSSVIRLLDRYPVLAKPYLRLLNRPTPLLG